MEELPFFPQPKPVRKKKKTALTRAKIAKHQKNREAQVARSACRKEVIERDSFRSRLTGRPVTMKTAEVHEIVRRSQGGDATDPANCIPLLHQEHQFFTLNYVDCIPVDRVDGANGLLRFVLTARGKELMNSTGTRYSLDRKCLADIWRHVGEEAR